MAIAFIMRHTKDVLEIGISLISFKTLLQVYWKLTQTCCLFHLPRHLKCEERSYALWSSNSIGAWIFAQCIKWTHNRTSCLSVLPRVSSPNLVRGFRRNIVSVFYTCCRAEETSSLNIHKRRDGKQGLNLILWILHKYMFGEPDENHGNLSKDGR